MSLAIIENRLDLVEEMIQYPQLRQDITTMLARTYDSLRLVTKFTYGRGDADDLMDLSKTIRSTDDIVNTLREHASSRSRVPATDPDNASGKRRRQCIASLHGGFRLQKPLILAHRIEDSIDEEGLSEYHRIENEQASESTDLAQEVLGSEAGEEDIQAFPKKLQPKPKIIIGSVKTATDGRDDIYIMKRNASQTLECLHNELEKLDEHRAELEERLRARLNASSLTLKWTPNLAHIAYVKGKDVKRVPETYRSLSSSSTLR